MSNANSTDIEHAAAAVSENPDAVTAAVQTSHSAAAPAGAMEQGMAAIIARLETAEAALTKYAPVIEAMETMLAAEVPAAGPVINKVTALEQWALGVIDHFQGKIPPLTPTPAA
jgi:hypothetical protein